MAVQDDEPEAGPDDVTHEVAEALALGTGELVRQLMDNLEGQELKARARVEAEVDAAWAERDRRLSAR